MSTNGPLPEEDEREQQQVEAARETAKEERKDVYLQLINERWPADPDDWLTHIATTNVVLKRFSVNKRPHSGRGLSVTLAKHFAVMSFWMGIEDAEKHLIERIRSRRQDKENPDNAKDRHCLPNDIKWVLLNKLEGVGEGMGWKDLADDALGYQH